ncbi:hypothetical protein C8A01DRAFT_35189 [Parachaetomium inaequale]|uniref:Uncharacterized protein n=1 Tax=Parachaetomium inaequale TaxID=2588326 RepID=A0AAN6PKJ7_9PEZI|nr:hypothetical protein C8A01DRAFT_35189 [Parachaetomium inaequale]
MDLGFNAAIYVLQTAQSISTLLLKVVDDLMREIRQREEKCAETLSVSEHKPDVLGPFPIWTALVDNNFSTFGKENLAVVPKSKPGFRDPKPTLESMLEIIVTRDRAAMDELKSVQTDPDSEPTQVAELQDGIATLSLWDEMMLREREANDHTKPSHNTPPIPTPNLSTVGKEASRGLIKGVTMLPPESYRLVQQMVGAPDRQEAKAKHRWPKFVAAMKHAGFVPTEGAGSAVSFHSLDGSGSITFHKPHPDATIYPVLLRSFGRRLITWFGWSAQQFAVDD